MKIGREGEGRSEMGREREGEREREEGGVEREGGRKRERERDFTTCGLKGAAISLLSNLSHLML